MQKFKVVFLGNSDSGKTSLINLFFKNPNPLKTYATTIDTHKHNTQLFGQNCQFFLVDTSGRERLIPVLKFILKGKDPLIVIICYDINSINGDNDIQHYVDQVKSHNENAKIVILGTKQNLGENENQKNIEKEFSDYPLYKVGLNSQEILNQIFYCFYDEVLAQQTLIQEELQIDQNRKLIINQQEQNLQKKQKKKWFWGLCTYENDD